MTFRRDYFGFLNSLTRKSNKQIEHSVRIMGELFESENKGVYLSFVFEVYAQGQFVGSNNSNKYHIPSCYWAEQISTDNRNWFVNALDAINQGYMPCAVCNPPLPEPPIEDIISVTIDTVVDGDSFNTTGGYRIRLADINAPEIDEPNYFESKEYLGMLIENKIAILDVDSLTGFDQYGRYVCLVYVQYNSTHSLNVNQALVDGGFAIVDDYTNNEFNPTTWDPYYLTVTIPEFPLFLIVPIFLLSTLSALIVKRKIENR